MTNTKTQNIKKQNLMFIAKRFLLCVSRYALCAFCAVIILLGFGFANKALAGYATSTTFVSSVITLDSAYPGDLIDLGKRYNIDTLALTDDDSLSRIHYALEDVSNYTSATQWADIEGLTASTTLSKTFTGSGQALRWFRFNRVADTGVSPSNPQALAKLAAQTSGSELYKLWKGDGAGTFETRTPGSDGKNTGGYVITLPNAAIGGQPSASEEYRICNGNIGQIKNFTIKLLVKDSSDGYKSGELSWNDTNWYSWDPNSTASTTTGAIINWQPIGEGGHSQGYGSTIPKTTLDKNTSGCANYIPFWVRTKVPSSGVFEGSKSVRFYFEALVL